MVLALQDIASSGTRHRWVIDHSISHAQKRNRDTMVLNSSKKLTRYPWSLRFHRDTWVRLGHSEYDPGNAIFAGLRRRLTIKVEAYFLPTSKNNEIDFRKLFWRLRNTIGTANAWLSPCSNKPRIRRNQDGSRIRFKLFLLPTRHSLTYQKYEVPSFRITRWGLRACSWWRWDSRDSCFAHLREHCSNSTEHCGACINIWAGRIERYVWLRDVTMNEQFRENMYLPPPPSW